MNKEQSAYRDALGLHCQLCGHTVKRLVTDHDHRTELIRGFVCDVCNIHIIPAGERRPELVDQKVLDYLSNPPLIQYAWRYPNPTKGTHKSREEKRARLEAALYEEMRDKTPCPECGLIGEHDDGIHRNNLPMPPLRRLAMRK